MMYQLELEEQERKYEGLTPLQKKMQILAELEEQQKADKDPKKKKKVDLPITRKKNQPSMSDIPR